MAEAAVAAASITQDDVVKLQQFHQQHFPGQSIPNIQLTPQPETQIASTKDQDDLGYYEDGVRRTLTDEQIAMFRHSEIQRLLAERRRKQEVEEEQQERQARRRRVALEKEDQQARLYATDAVVHARNDIQKLSYDDDAEDTLKTEQPEKQKPKTFQWPVLGA